MVQRTVFNPPSATEAFNAQQDQVRPDFQPAVQNYLAASQLQQARSHQGLADMLAQAHQNIESLKSQPEINDMISQTNLRNEQANLAGQKEQPVGADIFDTKKPINRPVTQHEATVRASLENAAATSASASGARDDKSKASYIQFLQTHMQGIRGEEGMKKSEAQSTAAASVANRIKDLNAEGKLLNPTDYTDALIQLYIARAGVSATDQAIVHIRQETAAGKFNKMFTFATGQDAPATTQGVQDAILEQAQHFGHQADVTHEVQMRPRIGTVPDQWANDPDVQRIVKTGRGASYAELTRIADEERAAKAKPSLTPGTAPSTGFKILSARSK